MKTGTHGDGKAIYGPRPSVVDMEGRAKREKVEFSKYRSCIVTNGRYWTEGWALPGNVDNEFYIYTYRRDGRVGVSWVPISADRIEFEGSALLARLGE